MIRPPSRQPLQNKPFSIRGFLGMDVTGTRDLRRSPDMLNCVLDDEGTPEMRLGFEKTFADSLGTGKILGIHEYLKSDGTKEVLIHHGTKLYRGLAVPSLLYTGVSDSHASVSFPLGTKLGIMDGTNFVIYNGTTVVTAASAAYIPTVYMSGDRIEDFNLIQPKWIEFHSTVNSTLIYNLSETNIDSLVYVKLNGATLTVTTDYTVVTATGVLTLIANPGNGDNNLEVQISKDRTGYADRIKKCTIAHTYGGPSDFKVFVSGNPDYPHMDWWSGLPLNGAYDPTYWPDTNYDRVGGDNDPIVGYEVQYDKLEVIKRNSVYHRTWELGVDAFGRTVMRHPATPLNSSGGCIAAGTIALLRNNPVFLSDNGMLTIEGTTTRDERNVQPFSPLTGIVGDEDALGIDFDGKYYLALPGGIVWVCDYNRGIKDEATGRTGPVWYKWTGVNVGCWYASSDTLYFGSNTVGGVYNFKAEDHVLPYNDDGVPISPCYWNSIFSTFDRDDMTKLVQKATITQKPASHSTIVVGYSTEEGDFDDEHEEPLDFMDYDAVDYDRWSYLGVQAEQAFTVRIDNARNVQRFQIRLSSSGVVDDFMGFSSIDLIYQYLSGVR
jgi:hypothetical protein